jgi:valyl-tRNA synthetase
VWSWWQQGSIHRASWPDAAELRLELAGAEADGAAAAEAVAEEEAVALEVAANVLREVRKAKSQAQRPMRAPVRRVLVKDTALRLKALQLSRDDLIEAGVIETLDTAESDELAVEVELAENAG